MAQGVGLGTQGTTANIEGLGDNSESLYVNDSKENGEGQVQTQSTILFVSNGITQNGDRTEDGARKERIDTADESIEICKQKEGIDTGGYVSCNRRVARGKYSIPESYSLILKDIIKGNQTIKPAQVRPLMLSRLGWTEETQPATFISTEKVWSSNSQQKISAELPKKLRCTFYSESFLR